MTQMTTTYGPAYEEKIDGQRLRKQTERIKYLMLDGKWRTLAEIEDATGYPQASISAPLRHLRKRQFGSYRVDKKRRSPGLWEYQIRRPMDFGCLF